VHQTTAKLARNYDFMVKWYGMRPRSGLRAQPMLDQTDQEPAPYSTNYPQSDDLLTDSV
jgi:hypothetical protein